MSDHTSIRGVYAGFEDCMLLPPLIQFRILTLTDAESIPSSPAFYALSAPPHFSPSPLRQFICLPRPTLLVLGPRRHPALSAAKGNTHTSLNINTSVGYRQMEVPDYISAVEQCGADIAVGIADIDLGLKEGQRSLKTPGVKRRDHVVENSGAWMRGMLGAKGLFGEDSGRRTSLWAPIPPLDKEVQRSYLETLEEGAEEGKIEGLVVYQNDSIEAVPESMLGLPRLALTEPRTPGEVLDAVGLGFDLVTAPFVTKGSEAGVGFTFEFPAEGGSLSGQGDREARRVLGVDMWDAKHAKDTRPLVEDCECYACTKHSRAFVQHLLQAKEMLAWVLLQIHNHHIMDKFFEGLRKSITANTFDEDVDRWMRAYESEFPEFVGQGPRIRGYQVRNAEPGPAKKNKTAYTRLVEKAEIPHRPNDRKEKLAEGVQAQPLDPNADAVDLEEVGFAQLYE
ncbi:MAG: hypothetical protein MMC23_001530 [Stictis urceolatum]|nr:hypothetical protein [Stictis urceolata]